MYDITLTNTHFFLPGLNNSTQCQIVAIFVFLFFFRFFSGRKHSDISLTFHGNWNLESLLVIILCVGLKKTFWIKETNLEDKHDHILKTIHNILSHQLENQVCMKPSLFWFVEIQGDSPRGMRSRPHQKWGMGSRPHRKRGMGSIPHQKWGMGSRPHQKYKSVLYIEALLVVVCMYLV